MMPGEVLSILYFNLDAEQQGYLRSSPTYDPVLFGELDSFQDDPWNAANLLDSISINSQVTALINFSTEMHLACVDSSVCLLEQKLFTCPAQAC